MVEDNSDNSSLYCNVVLEPLHTTLCGLYIVDFLSFRDKRGEGVESNSTDLYVVCKMNPVSRVHGLFIEQFNVTP